MKVQNITIGMKLTYNAGNYNSITHERSMTIELDNDDQASVPEIRTYLGDKMREEVYKDIDQSLVDLELDAFYNTGDDDE